MDSLYQAIQQTKIAAQSHQDVLQYMTAIGNAEGFQNSVNSYGYQDAEGDDLPYMFGPYFGTMADTLFTKAESVAITMPTPATARGM